VKVKLPDEGSLQKLLSCFKPLLASLSAASKKYTDEAQFAVNAPDRAKMESINRLASSTSWVADRDGWVYLELYMSAGSGGARIEINGKTAFRIYQQNAANYPIVNHTGSSIQPICTGDVVTYVSELATGSVTRACYYIPPRKIAAPLIDETFSTTETNTNKLWEDGKPIYRRVFTGQITAAANVQHDVTLMGNNTVSELISCGGYVMDSSNSKVSLNGITETFVQTAIWISINGSISLRTQSPNARTNKAYKVWVEYTRS